MENNAIEDLEVLQSMSEEQKNFLQRQVRQAKHEGRKSAPILNWRGKIPEFPKPKSDKKLRIVVLVILSPILLPLTVVCVIPAYLLCVLVDLAVWSVFGGWSSYDEHLKLTKWILETFGGYDEWGNLPDNQQNNKENK